MNINKAIGSKKINSAMTKEAMISYAKHLYYTTGISAVFEYANTLPNDVVQYGHCKGCNTDVPSIDGECLVCGQPVVIKEKCVEPCITQEMHNDLIAAYNEAKMAKEGIQYFADSNIVKAIERIDSVIHWLSKYVTDDDDIKELK